MENENNRLTDEQSERICLGAALNRKQCCSELLKTAKEEMFEMPESRTIFEAIKYCGKIGHDVDRNTIAQAISVLHPDIDMAPMRHLVDAIHAEGQHNTAELQLPVLVESYIRRGALQAMALASKELCKGKEKAHDTLAKLSSRINALRVDRSFSVETGSQIYDALYDGYSIEETLQGKYVKKMELSTGFCELDKRIEGLKATRFIVIGARAGVGKTQFICHLIKNSISLGTPVLVFSMEMDRFQYVQRLAGIVMEKAFFNVPTLYKNRFAADQALEKIGISRAYIDNLRVVKLEGIDADQMDAIIEEQVAEAGVKVVFVDHLGLIDPHVKNASPHERESHNSTCLKKMAMKHNVCIVSAVQLNRNLESRTDKTPILSDLRNSGDIEQDADQVIMLSRNDANREVFVDICKNRHGIQKVIKFLFDLETQTMEEVVVAADLS